LCAFALSFVPSFASADEQSLATVVYRRVADGILQPLAELESNRFSRARPMPHERRVRVLQTTETADKNGRGFVPFAIDVKYGEEWHENDVVGCAYTKSGDLFVKRGDAFRPAVFLLGKNVPTVAGVCQAGAARS
jgi:hypothetical protein